MANIVLIIILWIWLMIVSSFFVFDFAVYIKILSISIKMWSKEIISHIVFDPYPISSFWDFLYNFFLLSLITFGFVALATVVYSGSSGVLKYSPFLAIISFILGISSKIEWIDKITAPRINLFGKSIPLAVPWKLQGYVIKWRTKNRITIFYNILKNISVWLLILGMIFFIFLEAIFGNLTLRSFLPI